jgi:hypothetical protein
MKDEVAWWADMCEDQWILLGEHSVLQSQHDEISPSQLVHSDDNLLGRQCYRRDMERSLRGGT